MTDITADGQPFESPLASANQAYAATPPSLGDTFNAMLHESSVTEQASRVAEQGKFKGSSPWAQALYDSSIASPDGTPIDPSIPGAGTVETPMLSPEDANAKYAPTGPDGKPVAITTAPMPEGVAQLVGKAKQDQIQREGVIARYSENAGPVTTFGVNAAAFMVDPLNLATAFLPGFGEEAVTARLGGSFLARTAGRVVAGATGGAVAMAPLSGLRYGLGQLEASDYDLRSAFRDVAFGAAGGAVLHAGFGGLTDLIRGRVAEGAAPGIAAEADPILTANAETNYNAMRGSISQMAEGREVDVRPIYDVAPVKKPPDIIDFLIRRGGVQDESGELSAMDLNRPQRGKFGNLVNDRGLSLDSAREAAAEAGFIPHDTTVHDFMDAIHETQMGNPRYRDEDLDQVQEYKNYRNAQEANSDPWHPLNLFRDIAEDQNEIYRNGFQPGLTSLELEQAEDALFGARGAAEEGAKPEAETPQPKPQATLAEPAPAGETARRALSPQEQELATLEDRHATQAASYTADEQAELSRTSDALDHAQSLNESFAEAAACLGAGVV